MKYSLLLLALLTGCVTSSSKSATPAPAAKVVAPKKPAPKVEASVPVPECSALVEAFRPDRMDPIGEVGAAFVNMLDARVMTIVLHEVAEQIKQAGAQKGYKLLVQMKCLVKDKDLTIMYWDTSAVDLKSAQN
jgi:hypothetical protein